MADINSQTGVLSVGLQSAKDTAATKYVSTIATVSGMGVKWQERSQAAEHPSAGGIPWDQTKRNKRRVYSVPVKGTIFLRPNFLPILLMLNGFKCTTSAGPVANTYTHTLIPATQSELAWYSVLHSLGTSGVDLIARRARNTRGQQLTVKVGTDESTCDFTAMATLENDQSGSPTVTAEVDNILTTETGTLTCTLGGSALVTEVSGIDWQWTQTINDSPDRAFTTASMSLERSQVSSMFTINDVAASLTLWQKIARNAAAATAPTPGAAQVGALSYSILGDVIGATAQAASVTWTVPAVEFKLPDNGFEANGSNLIRQPLTAKVIGENTPAITIVVINGVAQYVA